MLRPRYLVQSSWYLARARSYLVRSAASEKDTVADVRAGPSRLTVHAARRTQLIESVVLVRSRRHKWRYGGWSEKSFLELMSELFGECDFGIARETRRRFDARILLLQFNLGHDAFLDAYRTPAIEMSCQNRA